MKEKAKTAGKRGAGGAAAARAEGGANKVFVGFWTTPTMKAAINTRAKIDRKSASALIDEIITDWLCGRRRK